MYILSCSLDKRKYLPAAKGLRSHAATSDCESLLVWWVLSEVGRILDPRTQTELSINKRPLSPTPKQARRVVLLAPQFHCFSMSYTRRGFCSYCATCNERTCLPHLVAVSKRTQADCLGNMLKLNNCFLTAAIGLSPAGPSASRAGGRPWLRGP